MQFINIAIVLLAVNINLSHNEKGKFLGFLPIFNGKYNDFDSFWYLNIGKMLCMTLFLSIFSPHLSKLFWPVLSWIFRCQDRGCRRNLKVEDKVNTQLIL
jgi:hypothetical protein